MTQSTAQPKVIGLTGNIATGKSTVLAYLAAKGAHVVDADKLGHRAMQPDGPAFPLILAEFGQIILAADGTIDRPALGRVVFADPSALARLGPSCIPRCTNWRSRRSPRRPRRWSYWKQSNCLKAAGPLDCVTKSG